MTTADWMCAMNNRGVEFTSNGEKLRVEYAADALVGDLPAEAMARKQEILVLLRQGWAEAASALLSMLASRLEGEAIEDLRVRFLERAAICELEGGLDRAKAEQVAYAEISVAAAAAGDSS